MTRHTQRSTSDEKPDEQSTGSDGEFDSLLPGLRRRDFMKAGAAVGGLSGLAGCLGDNEDASEPAPDPVALDGGKTCDGCGMVIADHGGPNGQVFHPGDHPPGRDGPARYDSVSELVVDRDAAIDAGREPVATYVTDYAAVEYETTVRDGDRVISSHVTPDSFVDWREAVFVVESGVIGAMGSDPIPFSDREAAQSFVDAEGGRIVEPDAVAVEFVSSL